MNSSSSLYSVQWLIFVNTVYMTARRGKRTLVSLTSGKEKPHVYNPDKTISLCNLLLAVITAVRSVLSLRSSINIHNQYGSAVSTEVLQHLHLTSNVFIRHESTFHE